VELLPFVGKRYRGKFICDGDEHNIRECRPSFNPVDKCATGDLAVYCDRGLCVCVCAR